MSTLIKDALIINEGLSFKGSLLIDGDVIGKIFKDNEPVICPNVDNIQVIDADGMILIPGVIDDQVHFREPGDGTKGDISSESAAAVLGGVTSYMDMPNNIPPACSVDALEQKYTIASKRSSANYSFYLGATNDNIEEILKIDPGKVCGVKVFMGSSTGNMLVDNPESLSRIFCESPSLIATHCEEESIIKANLAYAKGQWASYPDGIPFSQHPFIRSREACIASTSKAINLALKYHSRLHILHISTAQEIEMLREAKKKSNKITGEVCVHYLWFNDLSYNDKKGAVKCNPAIKSSSDMEALREAVRSGWVDTLATDHAPHLFEEKHLHDYLNTPSGIPLVQHSLQMMLQLSVKGIFPIEQVVQMMCHAPAQCFCIKKRGYIREGYYADLVLIKKTPFTVNRENIAYRCGWSPLEGETFDYSVENTFVNGEEVVRDGTLTSAISSKRLLFDK